ncbi:MAG: hypothetical protein PQJ59_10035 [Spirochaetales bacterium]|nr:hypothetical protein [Spirochaetales bacterium]
MKKHLALLVLFMVLVPYLSAEINVPYSENFDSLAPGDEISEARVRGDETSTSKVSNSLAYSGGNSLYMSDYSTADSAEIQYKILDELASGTVKYAIYIPSNEPGTNYCTLGTSTSSSGYLIDVSITSAGNIKYRRPDRGLETVTKISLDAWHTVEIKWNTSANQFIMMVDGEKVVQQGLIQNAYPSYLFFKTGSNSKTGQAIYLDDISLTR